MLLIIRGHIRIVPHHVLSVTWACAHLDGLTVLLRLLRLSLIVLIQHHLHILAFGLLILYQPYRRLVLTLIDHRLELV